MGEKYDWADFIQALWQRENAEGLLGKNNVGGYKDGKYYPHRTKLGNLDIGPGIDLDQQDAAFRKRAEQGFTKAELDSIVKDWLGKENTYFDQRIAKEGGKPQNVSQKVREGLLDMYWQVHNGLYGFDNLWKSVAAGDYPGMQKHSATYYGPEGNKKLDKGRWEFRKENYFKKPSETPSIPTPLFPHHIEQPDALRVTRPVVVDVPQRQYNGLSASVEKSLWWLASRSNLKDRIAANEKLRQKYKYGSKNKDVRQTIDIGLEVDRNALEALRKTFKTGKPVTVNEMSFINRNWVNNGAATLTPSPLSLMQNYTLQYDKKTGRMNYWDTYDFNQFESFVPGKPFGIKGSVKVRRQKKK